MIPPLLERLSNSKQMLVVAVYLSMFLDNILLTVVVPIIPDYLYTSEQKEYSPATQNVVSLLSLEPALTNSSTFLQCLENSVPTEKSPRVQPASNISLHKGEKTVTAENKKVMSNIESEYHAHKIQSDIHSQNLNKQDGHVNIQQINQQNTKDRDHPYGNQYTETINQRPVYKRGDKDKYSNIVQYSKSIKHEMSMPSEEFNTTPEFQNSNVFYDNSSTKDYNILSTEDRKALRHEDEQKQQTKTKLTKELEYIQNHTARTLTQDHQKYMKNLMIPDYLHSQENQHSTTTEGLNDTGQHSALQNWSEAVELKSVPSSKQASTLNNSNFSISRRQHNGASSGAAIISASHGVIEENGRVGLLLSSKALIQLMMNPVVGALTAHVGYQLPLFVGSINLLVATLLFAFGEHFLALLLARSLQGIASACISVSGMCLVAEQFPDDVIRSRIMGIVLGSMALGVLVGYPFGSLMYDFVGKMAPFFIISVAVFLNGASTFKHQLAQTSIRWSCCANCWCHLAIHFDYGYLGTLYAYLAHGQH
ncbi:uncharacterized protein LOC111874724 isoform X2 [Cryptotermes secundus]|uniref:uncharacterized protein LOC111874724 isoform X2 n=1 Tax=Cryptotermes secundus TaxID=105785 RepID=UPI001454E1FB|nr:uncharacterized protein LOC111874724 isoform X2 [Cryptotermes secundus]